MLVREGPVDEQGAGHRQHDRHRSRRGRPQLGPGELGHAAREGNQSLEAEHTAGSLRRGGHVTHIGQPVRAAHHRQRMTWPVGVAQRPGQVSHRVHDAAGDVESALDRVRREEGRLVGQCHVGHVDEVAPLAAVLVHERRLASLVGAAEDAGHAGVRGVPGHARAVDVVIAQGAQAGARLS